MTPVAQISLWPWRMPVRALRPTMAQIVAQVAARHGVTTDTLRSHERRPALAEARAEAWGQLRDRTDRSFPQIGAYFNGRDHSTIQKTLRRRERAS